MLSKFRKLFYTLRYITLLQLFYQIWYRVKNRFISINWYKKYLSRKLISPIKLSVDVVLQIRKKEYLLNNEFSFLNLNHTFKNQIDWNYNGFGKLWNYNLQYFSFLLDEDIPLDERLHLLHNFSINLLENKIPLEPYPVSLRVINTLLFYNRHPILDEVMLNALLMQVNYLENNLEYHILANHLLENAFAIFIAAIFIDDKYLLKKGEKLLKNQLEKQVLNDGGHYECSPMYQSILLSRLLHTIDISKNVNKVNNETIHFFEYYALKMLSWLNAYSFPDDSWALMNDSALEVAPTNEQLFSAAKILNLVFGKSALKESGFRKFSGKNWEIIIKIGKVEPAYQPGHIHADILSFCLWVDGKQVIVDSGTSTYSISKQRIKERSTIAHNTISISGFNQSDVWSGFRVGKRAKVIVLNDKADLIEAVVYFQGLKSISHKRTFKVQNSELQIIDEVASNKIFAETKFIGSLHFANDVLLKAEGTNFRLNDNVLLKTDNEFTTSISEYAVRFNELIKSHKVLYPVVNQQKLTFVFL